MLTSKGQIWRLTTQLSEALFNPDPIKATYAMDAMMKMKKIIIADLYKK